LAGKPDLPGCGGVKVGDGVDVGVIVGGSGVRVGGLGVCVNVIVGEGVPVGGRAVFVGVVKNEIGRLLHAEVRITTKPIAINHEPIKRDLMKQPPRCQLY